MHSLFASFCCLLAVRVSLGRHLAVVGIRSDALFPLWRGCGCILLFLLFPCSVQCSCYAPKRLLRKTAKPVGASGGISGTSAFKAEAGAVGRVAERPRSSDSEEPMECDVGGSADEDALCSPLETEAELSLIHI